MECIAIFIGENGSCGFEKNKEYKLVMTMEGEMIYIKHYKMKASKVTGELKCVYSGLKKFLDNWEVIR